MTFSLARTIASVAVVSYAVALGLESWRPGFVTFFWNPQILLLVAIGGAVLGTRLPSPTSKWWKTVAFFVTLAIVGAILVRSAFPPSGTRLIAALGIILLVLGAACLNFKKGSASSPTASAPEAQTSLSG